MLKIYPPSVHHNSRGVTLTFSEEIDSFCNEIHDACDGVGTDEEKINEILGPLSSEDRFLVAARYKELFEKSLRDEMKSETSGHYRELLEMISVPLPECEARLLRDACKGAGTDEHLIYPIVAGRTNGEMLILKKKFYDIFDKDLVVTLDDEFSGDLKMFMLGVLQGAQDEFNPSVHTEEVAEKDAEKLYDAGQGRFGTNEDDFIKTLLSFPPEHLANVNKFYVEKYGNTIEKAIKKEFSGILEKALICQVDFVLKPYQCIADLIEHRMKGIGTDEKGLSALIVRYQHVLTPVKEAYEKAYDRTLQDRIEGEVSGDYKDLLLKIVNAPESDFSNTSRSIGDDGDGAMIGAESVLESNSSWFSPNDEFRLIMQSDGNLVLYNRSMEPLWSSETCGNGEGPFKCCFQGDGNLVVYDGNGEATWASNTGGSGGAFFSITNSGSMAICDNDNNKVWSP